jgi:hypothetical protein
VYYLTTRITHCGGHVNGAFQNVLFTDIGKRTGRQYDAAVFDLFGDVTHAVGHKRDGHYPARDGTTATTKNAGGTAVGARRLKSRARKTTTTTTAAAAAAEEEAADDGRRQRLLR